MTALENIHDVGGGGFLAFSEAAKLRAREGREVPILTEHEIEELAVKRVFAMFGVDAADVRQVSDFQDDLKFAKKMRSLASHSVFAFAAIVVAGIAATVWAGIVALVHKG